MSAKTKQIILCSLLALVPVFLFQNCGKGFAPRGSMSSSSFRLSFETPLSSVTPDFLPRTLQYDPNGWGVYFIDEQVEVLAFYDAATSETFLVSGYGRGNGPSFNTPTHFAISADGTYAYVIDPMLKALFEVDLATGDRTIISESGVVGDGPNWTNPVDIVLNLNGLTAYVYDSLTIYSVDIASGDRAVVASQGIDAVGSGPNLDMDGMEITPDGETILLWNDDTVLGVDLASGNREKILEWGATWRSFALSPDGSRLAGIVPVPASSATSVFVVDLNSYDLTYVPTSGFSVAYQVDFDSTGSRVLVHTDNGFFEFNLLGLTPSMTLPNPDSPMPTIAPPISPDPLPDPIDDVPDQDDSGPMPTPRPTRTPSPTPTPIVTVTPSPTPTPTLPRSLPL